MVWVGVSLLILSVISVSVLTFKQKVNTSATRRLVVQTYKSLQLQQRFLALIRDSESGQRGYILTADPAYLAPYKRGTALVLPRMMLPAVTMRKFAS
jgi:CHASE3 domain sensor protein